MRTVLVAAMLIALMAAIRVHAQTSVNDEESCLAPDT